MNSRQIKQTRLSFRTNRKKPSHNAKSSQIALLFLFICASIIIYSLIDPTNKEAKSVGIVEAQSERIQETKQISTTGAIGKYTRQHMLYIPVIKNQSASCKKKTKAQLHQQNEKNIKIFNMLNKYNNDQANKQKVRQQHFRKIIPLKCVKHNKFTSPRFDYNYNKLSTILLDWINPFYNRQDQEYYGIQSIFVPNNIQVWAAYGSYLTIVSDQLIEPALVYIKIPQKQNKTSHQQLQNEIEQDDYIYIFGLSALDSALTNRNTLQTSLILRSPINEGVNQIQCNKVECNMQYSMIMFMMANKKKIQILQLEIYRHKK